MMGPSRPALYRSHWRVKCVLMSEVVAAVFDAQIRDLRRVMSAVMSGSKVGKSRRLVK